MNIFVNGFNAKSGGGVSILNNYLTLLKHDGGENHYFILTPNNKKFLQFNSQNINFVEVPSIFKKHALFPFFYTCWLAKLLGRLDIDVVFNLADVPIRTKITQVFLFDWSYAVYPDSIVWKMMDWKSLVKRKVKLFFFKKLVKHVNTMIVQTSTMKKRMEDIYKVDNIQVIPNAVPLENFNLKESRDFKLNNGIYLLYLTYYYPHKNLEIILPLARMIKEGGLQYKIVITIDESQHGDAKKVLNNIKEERLDHVIQNVGPIESKYVASLYEQCDALLMPTLLESFGLTYLEAMHNKLPILTSDMDFSRDVCGDSAYYFDPLDAKSILQKINLTFADHEEREYKIRKGTDILSSFFTWEEVLSKYNNLLLSEDTQNEK